MARHVPNSRRFVAVKFGRDFFALLGGFATLVAVVQVFAPSWLKGVSLWYGGIFAAVALGGAALRAFPPSQVSAMFDGGPWTVVVKTGDLFEEAAIVVTTDRAVSLEFDEVGASSLVWQLIQREYESSPEGLRNSLPEQQQSGELAAGTLLRVASKADRCRFLLACSRKGTAGSEITAGELWSVYERLWSHIRKFNLDALAVPLIGSGFSRSQLSDTALLAGLLLSFHGSSLERPVCSELRVIVPPGRLGSFRIYYTRSLLEGLGYRVD